MNNRLQQSIIHEHFKGESLAISKFNRIFGELTDEEITAFTELREKLKNPVFPELEIAMFDSGASAIFQYSSAGPCVRVAAKHRMNVIYALHNLGFNVKTLDSAPVNVIIGNPLSVKDAVLKLVECALRQTLNTATEHHNIEEAFLDVLGNIDSPPKTTFHRMLQALAYTLIDGKA